MRYGYSSISIVVAVLICLALLGDGARGEDPATDTRAPVPGRAAQAGHAPTQAVVYNGSSSSSSLYLVAFTETGFLIELASVPLPLCVPAEPSDGTRRVQAVTERAIGVYRAGLGMHGVDPARWPLFLGHWPPFMQPSLGDDCDALAQIDAVQQYFAQVSSTAASRRAATAACVAEVAQLACQLKLAASAVATVPATGDPFPCALLIPGQLLGQGSAPLCAECVTAVGNLPGLLYELATKRAECEFIRDDVAGFLDALVDALASATPVREDVRDCALMLGPNDVEFAYAVLHQSDLLLAAINASKEPCTLEQLEASCPCDAVPDSARGHAQPRETGDGEAAIDRLARAFAAAAHGSPDPDERLQLALLARRLERIPARRVTHVMIPSDSQLTQDLVAIRSPCAVDDPYAPLAVVLTLMPAVGEIRLVDPEERRRLFDAFKLFAQTLAAERRCARTALHATTAKGPRASPP